jgi:hypothetical protein
MTATLTGQQSNQGRSSVVAITTGQRICFRAADQDIVTGSAVHRESDRTIL